MHDSVDFVLFVVTILAFVIGKEVAITVGPYAAIALAAGAGVAIHAPSLAKGPWREAVYFLGLRLILAIVLTVSIAKAFEFFYPSLERHFISSLPVIAFGIGVIKDYKAFGMWFLETVRKIRFARK